MFPYFRDKVPLIRFTPRWVNVRRFKNGSELLVGAELSEYMCAYSLAEQLIVIVNGRK